MSHDRSIAVYYEHPHWFRPLFAELERRGLPYERIRADRQVLDPAAALPGHDSLFFNRMSPSAWERGGGGAVLFTLQMLAELETAGVSVINGTAAYRLEINKGLQIALLERLGLPVPRTRIVYRPEQLAIAASGLEFPLIVKPNVGGNGAGILRLNDPRELETAVAGGSVVAGPDGVLLLQEYHPPRGRSIVRVETLEGRFLYAIRVHLGHDEFHLCPADLCNLVSGEELAATARAEDAGSDARVEPLTPSPQVVAAVERIARAACLDVGGVEYLESERDGRLTFYDINALSNFVADAEKVVGFDPTARLVDSLVGRLAAQAA